MGFFGVASWTFIIINLCKGYEIPQKQRLKERFNFNFQKKNKTKVCDLKIKTQKLWIRTRDVQDKCENGYL